MWSLAGTSSIHAGTRIGDGCVIQDSAVVGKPPEARQPLDRFGGGPPPASIGDGAAVCAGAVVLAGAEIGSGAVIGDQSQVRERARIGSESVVGRGSAVDNDVTIGDRVKIQTTATSRPGAWSRTTSSSGPARR